MPRSGTFCMLLFHEASTRTCASLELAGKILGSDTINARLGDKVQPAQLATVLWLAGRDLVNLAANHP